MEAVDVLVRINRGDHLLVVDMRRQRQLDENPVNRRIGVQLLDQRQHFGFGCVSRQLVLEAGHPGLDRLLALAPDIDLARRILADQHHGETRLASGAPHEFRGMRGHAVAQVCGKGLAVNQFRHQEILA